MTDLIILVFSAVLIGMLFGWLFTYFYYRMENKAKDAALRKSGVFKWKDLSPEAKKTFGGINDKLDQWEREKKIRKDKSKEN